MIATTLLANWSKNPRPTQWRPLAIMAAGRVGLATSYDVVRDGQKIGRVFYSTQNLWVAVLDTPCIVVRGRTLAEVREKIGREVARCPGQ
jgi:hypothetical protein